MTEETQDLLSQIRSCLEWRDGPLAPERRVQVITGHSEEFWEALRLLFAAPAKNLPVFFVRVAPSTNAVSLSASPAGQESR